MRTSEVFVAIKLYFSKIMLSPHGQGGLADKAMGSHLSGCLLWIAPHALFLSH